MAKRDATGHTVRIADIPYKDVRRAVLELVRDTSSPTERLRLLQLLIAPGNAGGRIAA